MHCKPPGGSSRRRSQHQWVPALLILIAACAPAGAFGAPNTDVLVFLNGDRLAGEVKGLPQRQVSFRTDATGTISVEWAHLASMQSAQMLQAELTSR